MRLSTGDGGIRRFGSWGGHVPALRTAIRLSALSGCHPRRGWPLHSRTAVGKLYPILARLERAGWLIKEREDIDPAVAGRPARRLYRLSPDGIHTARRELAGLSEQLRLPATGLPGRLRPEGGRA